jgi:hypothetical protein
MRKVRVLLVVFATVTCYSFIQPFAFPEEIGFPAEHVTLNDADEIDGLLFFRSEESERVNYKSGTGSVESIFLSDARIFRVIQKNRDVGQPDQFARHKSQRCTFLVNQQFLI